MDKQAWLFTKDRHERFARHAYENYGRVTDFKNYQGLPMPKWEDLPPKIQVAWKNAVASVMLDLHVRGDAGEPLKFEDDSIIAQPHSDESVDQGDSN